MKCKIQWFLVLIVVITGKYSMIEGNGMSGKERYFSEEEFRENFGKEMVSCQNVYQNMKKTVLKDYQFCEFDFNYTSDKKEKLVFLGDFLKKNYKYKMEKVKKIEGQWELWGSARKYPVDGDNLLFWALDLYIKGFNYDCVLVGYGAAVDTESPEFPNLNKEKADYYFNVALEEYEKKNTGFAIIHWSTAIKIDPKDPNSYYSRAIAKNELYTWKAALRDYDKAIEIAPNFVDAYVNRGTVKDEAGNYDDAIEDYCKAIELKPDNEFAYFNRGNSKLNKGDNEGACSDWKKAKELGAEYADERINQYCIKKDAP